MNELIPFRDLQEMSKVMTKTGLFKKTYDVDLEAAKNAMGGNLWQGLQGLPFFR